MKTFDEIDTETLAAIKGALNSHISSPLERLAHAITLFVDAMISDELDEREEKEPKVPPGVVRDQTTSAMTDALPGEPNTVQNPTNTSTLKPNV